MKHVEARPWFTVRFPSLCRDLSIEYQVFRGCEIYGKERGDMFFEIRNDAYFHEFSIVSVVWDKDDILREIAYHQAFYMTHRGAFRWIFGDEERLRRTILEFLERTVEFPPEVEEFFAPQKPPVPKSGSAVKKPDKTSSFSCSAALANALSDEMTKRGFTSSKWTDISGLSPSEAYCSGKISLGDALKFAETLKTIAESNTVHAEEAANILHRVTSASTVTSKRF